MNGCKYVFKKIVIIIYISSIILIFFSRNIDLKKKRQYSIKINGQLFYHFSWSKINNIKIAIGVQPNANARDKGSDPKEREKNHQEGRG